MESYKIYLLIIAASILISQEATKYRLTRVKPFKCEYCMCLWLTSIYTYEHNTWPFIILYSMGNAFLCKLIYGLYMKYIGYVGL